MVKCANPNCNNEVPKRKDKYCSYQCANAVIAKKMIDKHKKELKNME